MKTKKRVIFQFDERSLEPIEVFKQRIHQEKIMGAPIGYEEVVIKTPTGETRTLHIPTFR